MEDTCFNIDELKVTYGHGNRIKDVTKKVLDKFYNKENKKLKFMVKIIIEFGDPIGGKVKQLIFTYKDQRISFPENQNLVLNLKNNKLELNCHIKNIVSQIRK